MSSVLNNRSFTCFSLSHSSKWLIFNSIFTFLLQQVDLIAYNDILNLQDRINDKLEEIEDSIKAIIKVGDGVDADRRAAFDSDMTPDEIQKFGIKNRLPKNVIYKMLEKYHYLNFYKKCKKILDDGKVTDKEIGAWRWCSGGEPAEPGVSTNRSLR